MAVEVMLPEKQRLGNVFENKFHEAGAYFTITEQEKFNRFSAYLQYFPAEIDVFFRHLRIPPATQDDLL